MATIDGGGPSASELGITPPSGAEKPQSKGTSPVKEGPKELTPADRAVNKALKGIGDVNQDLLSAGVTEDQIQAAKTKAEDRIRAEFKELESEDPLSIVEAALEAAATTDEERELVKININTLEWRRGLLARSINTLLQRKGYAQYEINNVVKDATRIAEWRRATDGTFTAYAILDTFTPKYSWQDSSRGEVILEADEAFQERFLREIGVLEDDQTLQDIFTGNYPRHEVKEGNNEPATPDGPYRVVKNESNTGWIAGFPTKIEGVYARIYPHSGQVNLAISAQALQKIQPSDRA